MSNIAIRVENISKQYQIAAARIRHDTLRDQIMHSVKSAFGLNGHASPASGPRSSVVSPPSPFDGQSDTFWALKDISFEIKQGEVVGIIGRNGAGKSTLLKVLSRIMEPSGGRAEIYGRVGSLLEVGTGFHAELTGRENIYLSGVILGMRKNEIRRKFDEIVAFAEVEKFIDAPVKHYSSGMYVRLAFAVAAHLEMEIMLIDEVLAVGDVTFQKKCLGKIGSVVSEGRTVLFVSHNMAAISQICENVIRLEQGVLKEKGPANLVMESYLGGIRADPATVEIPESKHSKHYGGTSKMRLCRVQLITGYTSTFMALWKEPIRLLLTIQVNQPVKHAVFGLGIRSLQGTPILAVHHNDYGEDPLPLDPGVYQIQVTLDNPLRAGRYVLEVGAHNGISTDFLFHVPEAVTFAVSDVSNGTEKYVHTFGGLVNGSSVWTAPTMIS